jgi:hypothetical protein
MDFLYLCHGVYHHGHLLGICEIQSLYDLLVYDEFCDYLLQVSISFADFDTSSPKRKLV